MSLTLLLDLDNTLLCNDMDKFVPPYIQGLAHYITPHAPAQKTIPALMAATQQMAQNTQPNRTLKAIFDAHFYPQIGATYEQAQPEIHAFYAERYPTLQQVTQPCAQAVELVEQAFARGYRVVIATNPFFPQDAIYQRLEWANLSPAKYPFALVTSYETAHFAKPNPAYYAEILAKLGWPEGPVVMVGNELELDIKPARELGISTYWVTATSAAEQNGGKPAASAGPLANVLPWLDQTDPAALTPSYATPAATLPTLHATPAALGQIIANLPAQAWDHRPTPQAWTLAETFCHMRDVEAEVNLARVQQVIQHENPFIPGMDTDQWAAERQYCKQNGSQALHNFIATRLQLLNLLTNLTEQDWQRPARHAIFGPTHLQELTGFIAEHDRLHIQQIAAFLNTFTLTK